MDRKFWATTFTLTGTIIGAGILGLPYAFAKSGYLFGLFWVLFLGGVILYTFLCLGEISLRTKKVCQLPGYAEKYLGKKYKWIMFFAIIFGIYSALLAYLIGEGESFSFIFFGDTGNAVYFAFGFWLIMTLLLREGLRGLKRVESAGVIIVLALILIIIGFYFPQISKDNLFYRSPSEFFLPFGVVLFALLGFTSIPEIEMEIKGSEKKLKRAIITGVLIPVFVYAIFSLVFVGVLGKNVPQVATIGLGKLVAVLGIFTMFTAYFILSFSLKDVFKFDLKYSRGLRFFLVSALPILIYFILHFFNLLSFVEILGIGGALSGGLTGVLILIMNKKAKEKGDRKPEFSVPINWFIILLLIIVYIGGVAVEFLL